MKVLDKINPSSVAIEAHDYVPLHTKWLLGRIEKESYNTICLYGFGDSMKWLLRILKEKNKKVVLADWRSKIIGYDCGGEQVHSIEKFKNETGMLVVICLEEAIPMKDGIRFLIDKKIDTLPVIYERTIAHRPFHEMEPYKTISSKARARAISMISDDQLFDLIQYIKMTSKVEGDVLEFGSLHGGSGAILAESINHFGKKPVWLFDTFAGIPKSKYGLDHRWENSFSNNSYAEVKNAFADLENVKVVQGNLFETYKLVKNNISFCYIGSDTMESGELLLNFSWPKLSPGGLIVICDYGSFPNCIPLTVMTDKWLESHPEAEVFYPSKMGIVIKKNNV